MNPLVSSVFKNFGKNAGVTDVFNSLLPNSQNTSESYEPDDYWNRYNNNNNNNLSSNVTITKFKINYAPDYYYDAKFKDGGVYKAPIFKNYIKNTSADQNLLHEDTIIYSKDPNSGFNREGLWKNVWKKVQKHIIDYRNAHNNYNGGKRSRRRKTMKKKSKRKHSKKNRK